MLKKAFKILIFVVIPMLKPFHICAQDLIPLSVNNKWKYIENISINGKTIETDTIESTVKKRMVFNDKEWFLMNELGDEYIVRNDKLGQYELDTLSTLKNGDFEEVLMFKKSKKTASYTVFEDVKVDFDTNKTVITTPAGNFKCIKYSITYDNGEQNDELIEFYIKPGIGLIYHYWRENEKITTAKLIEYHIH